MGRPGHLPLRPHEDARADLLDRHSPADRQRVAARRTRLLLHAHRLHRALPAHARPRGVLPDGLGRQRPADRAARAELLRRALRPVAALRRRRSSRRPSPASSSSPSPGATSSSCASASPSRTRRSSRSCGAGSASRSTGRTTTRPSTPPLARASQRAFLRNLAARRGLPVRGAHALGRHVPHRRRPGRARGPRARGQVPPHRLPRPRRLARLHRDDAPRAARRVRRPRRAPRRRALPAAVRHHRAHAALRRRGAGGRAPSRRSREGLRHRDDLHVRRHHRRHVVARAAAAHPPDHRLGRPDPARDAGVDHDRRRPCHLRVDRGSDRVQREGAHGRGARRGRLPRGRAAHRPCRR